jgi:YD repeat-containing protein
LGGRTEYGYNDKGFLNSVIDSEGNKGKYLYDDKDRLREIHFPDGRWIEYNYRDKKGSKDSTQGQSITVISHLLSSPIGKIANKNENPVSVKVVVARSHVAWADVLSWFNGIGIFHVEK